MHKSLGSAYSDVLKEKISNDARTTHCHSRRRRWWPCRGAGAGTAARRNCRLRAVVRARRDRRWPIGVVMQQIADWLEKLGLSEYAQRFAENGIDISVLRYLTDQDLKDIGVLLGHRRKMLAAISELTGAAPVTSEAAAVEAQ